MDDDEDEDEDDWVVPSCGKTELRPMTGEVKEEEEEDKDSIEVVEEEEGVGWAEEERVVEYVLEEGGARREIGKDTLDDRDEEEDNEES